MSGDETQRVELELEDDEYHELLEFKENNGYTWKGVLLHGLRDEVTDERT